MITTPGPLRKFEQVDWSEDIERSPLWVREKLDGDLLTPHGAGVPVAECAAPPWGKDDHGEFQPSLT